MDQHWAEILQVIQDVAKKHFSKQPSKQCPDLQQKAKLRRDLLKRRAVLREELTDWNSKLNQGVALIWE